MTITINPKNKKELAKIKAVLKAEKIDFVEESPDEDWYEELSDTEKKSIELGLKDIEEGRVVAHSEVKKLYEKWL